MSLTSEQIAFRTRGIGGSDANTIMSGDADRIIRLWREKRGEVQPEDLSSVLPVRMGSWTEPLNVAWFEETSGRIVTHRGDERINLDEPIMLCTLDGLTDDGATVFEAKHVSAFAKPEEIRARYFPQIQHCMAVCGLQNSVLSVFYGTLKYEFYNIAADPVYQMQLIEAERHFWRCVENGEPPVAADVPVTVEAIRIVDMTEGNRASEWDAYASEWLRTVATAKQFEKTAKAIKEMVPDDAKEAFGFGIVAKRAKNGAITIKEF